MPNRSLCYTPSPATPPATKGLHAAVTRRLLSARGKRRPPCSLQASEHACEWAIDNLYRQGASQTDSRTSPTPAHHPAQHCSSVCHVDTKARAKYVLCYRMEFFTALDAQKFTSCQCPLGTALQPRVWTTGSQLNGELMNRVCGDPNLRRPVPRGGYNASRP